MARATRYSSVAVRRIFWCIHSHLISCLLQIVCAQYPFSGREYTSAARASTSQLTPTMVREARPANTRQHVLKLSVQILLGVKDQEVKVERG